MKKVVLILIGFLVFLGVYAKINKEAYKRIVDKNNNILQEFVITKGDGSTQVGENLVKAGLIKNKYYFWYYVWRTKTDSKLQAGKYELAKNMTIPEMVEKFAKGKVKSEMVKLTVPEGFTNDKIIKLLEEKKPKLVPEFESLIKCQCLNKPECACDRFSEKYDFIKDIPLGLDLEGYLFPDTYFIAEKDTGATLLSKFLNNFDEKVGGDLRREIKNQNKTLHQIITMASIVEREAKEDKDRPIIAGIFWNRFNINHPLQSDATLAYILKTDKVKYYQKEIETNSPYNTYKNSGLPPGPICNPGQESIIATIHPQKTDYFYFLNDAKTGETFFAKTLEEHGKNRREHGL